MTKYLAINSLVEKPMRGFVLFWDYDCPNINYNHLDHIAKKYFLDLWIFKTNKGYHFVSFHIFDAKTIQTIQEDFNRYFPSDYPLHDEMERQAKQHDTKFRGNTLRISDKNGQGIKRYYRSNKNISELKQYSGGHKDVYEKITGKHIKVSGKELKTNPSYCEFELEVKNG